MNDVDIKTLINAAVDGELAGHRVPPAWNRADLPGRSGQGRSGPDGPARRTAAWTVPLLAASAVALLAAGSILAIDHSRVNRSNQSGNPAGPAPSVPISHSVSTDLARAARAYSDAVAGAAPDPSKLAGVSVSAISAADAVLLKNSSALRADAFDVAQPQPGKTYSFTMSYLAGPGEPVAVVSIAVRDVASGSCPQPFLARAAYTYRIRCQVIFRAGAVGAATLTALSPAGASSASMDLADPVTNSSPSISPKEEQAAHEYSEALATAPEASTVAGVTERPATAAELRGGQGVGSLDTPVRAPDRGRTYPVTLIYTPASDGPAIAVLAIRFEDVTTGRCPRPFRTRPGHSYLIHCQVTFRAGAVGKAYYRLIGPHDTGTIGKTISLP